MKQTLTLPKNAGATAGQVVASKTPKRVTSKDLLGALGEMVITHNGREYRLRLTQNDKLILTA